MSGRGSTASDASVLAVSVCRRRIGTGAPCYSTPTGCPYDSLNVGAQTFPGAPYQGIDVDPDAVFLNSTDPAAYCDGGRRRHRRPQVRLPCWTANKPLAKITAV